MNQNARSLSERCAKDHGELTRLAHAIHSFYATEMTSAILSIGMIAGFALLWGAWALWRRDGLGQKVWLMIAAALVMFVNVAIWTVPDSAGNTLSKTRTR